MKCSCWGNIAYCIKIVEDGTLELLKINMYTTMMESILM